MDQNINHWSTGWVDWNMALTPTGGPHWPGGAMDSPVIVNAVSDENWLSPLVETKEGQTKNNRKENIEITQSS